jgi:hypothetical protein
VSRLKHSGASSAASKAYSLLREVRLAGAGGLEPLERVALLTVVSGLRPFAFLTHVRKEDGQVVEALLATLGLVSGMCKATFQYDLDVEAPPEVIDAFRAYEAKSALWGLGVAKTRVDFGDSPLGAVLRYPRCCWQMDDATKSHDRSVALRALIDNNEGNSSAVIEHLNRGARVETPSTPWKEAWDRRFDQTRIAFPFALHTACDQCLREGAKSPSGAISAKYERLVRAATGELHEAVLRQNDHFWKTSPSRQ